MSLSKPVFLVGPMGAGKTTIGRHLAAELDLPFIDTDEQIEQRTGADIPWIFDVEGEDGFRQRESKVLEELASTPAVIATGGGIVQRDENCQHMRDAGFVVYLHATVKQQLARTAKDRSRPLLTNSEDPEATLTALMNFREPRYRELADIVIQTDNRNPRTTAADIASRIKSHNF